VSLFFDNILDLPLIYWISGN